jgi:hypothetical protein
MKERVKAACLLVFWLYMLTVSFAAAYYNWQYAKENGFARWLVFGEVISTIKALGWPYFVSNRPKTGSGQALIGELGPKLNASELERFSQVTAKADSEPLDDSDLDGLRSVVKDYMQRTGIGLDRKQIDFLKSSELLGDDYQYELGQSALFSWDRRSYYTTEGFDGLYEKMKGHRKEDLLKKDLNMLRAAAENLTSFDDGQGHQYALSRKIILQGLERVEVSRGNWEKIIAVMEEFTQQR